MLRYFRRFMPVCHAGSADGRRGTEVVEAVLRHHIGACFAALERRVLDLLHEVLPQLHSFEAAKKKPMPGSQQTHPLVEVFPPL